MKCVVEIIGIHVNETDSLPLHYFHSVSYLSESVVEKVCEVRFHILSIVYKLRPPKCMIQSS